MKEKEELNIGKIYTEKAISNIISQNKNVKAIYLKDINTFKWGKEKLKLIQILEGYEQINIGDKKVKLNQEEKIKYLILDIKQ